jgi:GH25 family lysozyme M1 (1,4-beta-N-acetylmuramidase)
MIPRGTDIYHSSKVTSVDAFVQAGGWFVIHKASEHDKDPMYDHRRQMFQPAGVLWGAYHFNTGEDAQTQWNRFKAAAQPDDKTEMVLDYEGNKMGIHTLVELLRIAEKDLGRKLTIYSGNNLKEQIGKLNSDDRAYVCSHKLWLCQYGPKAVLPPGFTEYYLWQYTGDGVGLTPHHIDGIDGQVSDLNITNAKYTTKEQLTAVWAS